MRLTDLGYRLSERRKLLGITQADLAEMAEISVNTLYKVERGQANPSIKIINQLADVLGMELKLQVKQPKL